MISILIPIFYFNFRPMFFTYKLNANALEMRRRAGGGLPQRRLALLGLRRGVGFGYLEGLVKSAQRCLSAWCQGRVGWRLMAARYRPFAVLVTPLKWVRP